MTETRELAKALATINLRILDYERDAERIKEKEPWDEECEFPLPHIKTIVASLSQVEPVARPTEYSGPFFAYDFMPQKIMFKTKIGDSMALDVLGVRGWGYLTGTGGLNINHEAAAKIQDNFGKWVVETLNAALYTSPPPQVEPVAWRWQDLDGWWQYTSDPEQADCADHFTAVEPLYTSPAPDTETAPDGMEWREADLFYNGRKIGFVHTWFWGVANSISGWRLILSGEVISLMAYEDGEKYGDLTTYHKARDALMQAARSWLNLPKGE